VGALDLVDGWDAPQARAAVIEGDGRGVRAIRGDGARRSRWASVTKLVTALAVLVAVEEETVDLDQPAGPPGSTVRHLLAHASGLAFDGDIIVAKPGERRIYSNAGFEALAGAVSEATGMPFEDYAGEAVLEPLSMADTRFEAGGAAAGLVGPLDDLIRLAVELLAPTLLSTRSFREATTVAFSGLAGVMPGFGRRDRLDWGLGFELRDGKSPHWTGSETRRRRSVTSGPAVRSSGSTPRLDWRVRCSADATSGGGRRTHGPPWPTRCWRSTRRPGGIRSAEHQRSRSTST